jgi:hypothetical protein
MTRLVSLRLDSAGQVITFNREEVNLAPGETRTVGMTIHGVGDWQAVLLRLAGTELVFPIKIVVS